MTAQTGDVLPVVVFAYNRPGHLKRTLDALAMNTLASQAVVMVYSDAPRSESDEPGVQEVRRLLGMSWGFARFDVVLRDTNWGLAANITDGVTAAIKTYDQVIVLEDDIVTSPHFLTYMRDALACYRNVDEVMHVSASRYPIRIPDSEGETFFLQVPLCWGWATWGRAWKRFSRDLNVLREITPEERRAFDYDFSHGYWKQADANLAGRMNTWFIFWYACLFRARAVALFPRWSLAVNIGHDGTGEHCGASKKYDVALAERAVNVLSLFPRESDAIRRAHVRYFRYISSPSWRRRLLALLGVAPTG